MNKFSKYKRILTLILLPFVVIGLIYLFQQKKVRGVNALDLFQVTYNGNTPEDPVFVIENMLPGDIEYKDFVLTNVNLDYTFDILMKGEFVSEEKEFADILEITISEIGGSDIYGGTAGVKTLQDFLDETLPLNLGTFSPGFIKTYRVQVFFPHSSGNEYQLAKVVFDIIWSAEVSEDQIPPECRHLTLTRVIEGTEGNDKIHGTTASELILGKGGNDKIRASSGDDCIVGGDGNDYLEGESGDDVVLGGEGNDRIDVGKGNDTVYGGGGNDNIDTGSEADVVYGGDGNDNIDLGSGDDKAWGEAGNDNLDGGDGKDELWGGDGNDVLRGGSGDDKLYGEGGNDTIHANSGNDYLDGGADTDNLHGNTGTDTCVNGEVNASCEI